MGHKHTLDLIYKNLHDDFVIKNKREPEQRERQRLKSQAMNVLLCSIPLTDKDKM